MERAQQELHRAVAERHYPEVQRMLAEGVLPFPKLWFPAIQTGDVDICTLLLRQGLDPNESDASRKPLHFAAEAAREDIAELLIRAGADVNITDTEGMTPLDICCEFAADERAPNMVNLLLGAGAKVSFATALRVGDLGVVSESIEQDPEKVHAIPTTAIGTPLMIACRCGRTPIVAYLLSKGAHVNETNPRDPQTGKGGNTAMWFTAQGRRHGRGSVVRQLVAYGADLDRPGEYGESPLHVAVAWRNTEVAIELLEAGADPNPRTLKGETPVDFASKMGFREMESMVRAYGGTTADMLVPVS